MPRSSPLGTFCAFPQRRRARTNGCFRRLCRSSLLRSALWRIISVHINCCRFFILLLIINSGFHTEPWAVIFSDNAWQRQQNILKKLTKQPPCTTTRFNSNSKSDSLCSWKVAFFRFQNIILSLFFLLSWTLAQLIIFYSTSRLLLKDFISIQTLCSYSCKYPMLSQFQAYPFSLGIFLAFCSYSGHFSLTKASFG